MSGGRTARDERSGGTRLLDVLAAFEGSAGELTVQEIAHAAALPASTTYRLVRDLVDWGGLERTTNTRYRVGRRLEDLAGGTRRVQDLREVLASSLHRLVGRLGHAVAISRWDGARLVCVETLPGRHPDIELARPGENLSVLATSSGKLLVATGDRTDAFDPFATELPPRTDPATILRQLAVARRSGFCVAYGEAAAGQAALSVPVGTTARGPIALTLLTPVREPRLLEFLSPLRATAADLGQRLATVSH